MPRRKQPKPEVNLLELIPERLIEHETDSEGLVTLLAPRFRSKWLRRVVQPRFRKPFLKVSLDDIGSAVWKMCDGRTRVDRMCASLRNSFGDKVEPCYERIGQFLRSLDRARFIRFTNMEECFRLPPDQGEKAP